MQAIICIRSQHSVGGSGGRFGGPDRYVAVQIVPPGVEPLKQLNRKLADMRGIRIIHCGEGYSRNQATERSALGAAKAKAKRIADEINHFAARLEAVSADPPASKSVALSN